LSDKNFKVKNGLTISGLTGGAGPLIADSNKSVDSTSSIPTQYGGTGTTTSPTSGQILYSENGTTYAPVTLSNLAVTASSSTGAAKIPSGTTAERPASPVVGQIRLNTTSGTLEFYTGTSWGSIATFPQPPTSLVATDVGTSRAYNNGAASIAFTAAAADGGSTITSYRFKSNPSNIATVVSTTSPQIATGLASNTSYTFTGYAINSIGDSAESSASSSVTITTVPQAPTIGTVTVSSPGTVSVPFTAGATGGKSITSYTVTSSAGSFTATGSSSPISLTAAFTAGAAYTFTVTATNANGTSASSSASNSVTPVVSYALSQTFNSSGNYVVPAGKNYISGFLIAAGGGGGGGGSGNTGDMGYMGGGGGGSHGKAVAFKDYPVTPGETISITVGSSGNGGNGVINTAPSGAGNAGGATTLSNLITVNGGGGGGGGTFTQGGGSNTGNLSYNVNASYIASESSSSSGGSGGRSGYYANNYISTPGAAGTAGGTALLTMNLNGVGSVSSGFNVGSAGGGGGGAANNFSNQAGAGGTGGTGSGNGGSGGMYTNTTAPAGGNGGGGTLPGGAGGGGGGGSIMNNAGVRGNGGNGGAGYAGQVIIYAAG
jgi:hypothetical protein